MLGENLAKSSKFFVGEKWIYPMNLFLNIKSAEILLDFDFVFLFAGDFLRFLAFWYRFSYFFILYLFIRGL